METALQLDRVAFYGRTLAEYQKIFDFDLSAWKGSKILDCPAGASSFTAEAVNLGFEAVACDPMYGKDAKFLYERGRNDIDHVIERMRKVPHLYKWNFYPSIPALQEYRTAALERFARDYPVGFTQGRYVKASLPSLPFADASFDLVLSGHFLFTYCQDFDYEFHLASLIELYRVCLREVRIYPLQGPEAKPYGQMDQLLSDLKKRGIVGQIFPTSFEFQRGSNQQLRLMR